MVWWKKLCEMTLLNAMEKIMRCARWEIKQIIGDERFANYWRWLCLMPWTKWWEMQIIGDAATNFFCWHQVQRQTAKNNFDKICFVSYTNTIYTRFCNLYNTVFQFSNIFVNLYNLQFRQLSSASSNSSSKQEDL